MRKRTIKHHLRLPWITPFLFLLVFGVAAAISNPFLSGTSFNFLTRGAQSLQNTPNIAPDILEPGGGAGKAVGNVNVFTGQPIYSVPLGGLNVRGVLDFPL